MNAPDPWRNDKGIALVSALGAVCFLSIFATSLVLNAANEFKVCRSFRLDKVALYVAESGTEEARGRLGTIGDSGTPTGDWRTFIGESSEATSLFGYDSEDDDGSSHPQLLDLFGTSSSPDPSATGEDPKPHYDKDVARCTAILPPETPDAATVVKDNVYPSYHCTAWFDVLNSGTVPVKVKRIWPSALAVHSTSTPSYAAGRAAMAVLKAELTAVARAFGEL